MNKNEIFKINGFMLDREQIKVVKDQSKRLLVIASAGSGKSTTIVGKIKYLIKIKNIKENEILCISFTNDSCNSLENTLKKNNCNVKVTTFHKLALNILKKENVQAAIAETNLLNYLIDEYFESNILFENIYTYITLKLINKKSLLKKSTKKYMKYKDSKKLYYLKKQISKFILLFKSGGYNYDYLYKMFIIEKNKIFNKNTHMFITLCAKIMKEYENELKSENKIDFDDMISMSTEALKMSTNNLNYKYIFVDEFQDTSQLRFNLINEILNKSKANLIVVGDDYQSIYKFSGCDITLFTNFNKINSNIKILKIQTTYRNSKEVIKTTNKFITKNDLQIKKQIKSNKSLKKPIKVIYYENEQKIFIRLLQTLDKQNKKNILILGRNNNEINKVINKDFSLDKNGKLINKKLPELHMRFLTVHKSKGLEEDFVIVLSLENDRWSFPNKTLENKIFNYVMTQNEKYLYAEERRLFYVALTRTKNEVYLLTNKKSPSIFVKEIIKDSKENIEIINNIDKK